MTYKPWIKLRQYKKIDWWKYAKKSDYYNEICENYPNNYPKNFCKHSTLTRLININFLYIY